jgi:hypothetical protein
MGNVLLALNFEDLSKKCFLKAIQHKSMFIKGGSSLLGVVFYLCMLRRFSRTDCLTFEIYCKRDPSILGEISETHRSLPMLAILVLWTKN